MDDRSPELIFAPDQTEATSRQHVLLGDLYLEGERMFDKTLIYEKLGGTRQEAWGLFMQMLIYLWLAEIRPRGYRFSPPPAIDKVWHEFILFTEEYTEFCKNTVGHYIHHRPSTSANRSKMETWPQWLPEIWQIEEFVGSGITFIVRHWIDKADPAELVDEEDDGSARKCCT
jgi:hypothetical protein